MAKSSKKAAKKVAQKKSAARTSAPKMAGQSEFRVVHLPVELKAAFQKRREAEDTSNEALLTQVVKTHLMPLVAELLSSGVRHGTDLKPARWPFAVEVLESLRAASHKTGVPAAHLLTACLRRALPEGKKAKS